MFASAIAIEFARHVCTSIRQAHTFHTQPTTTYQKPKNSPLADQMQTTSLDLSWIYSIRVLRRENVNVLDRILPDFQQMGDMSVKNPYPSGLCSSDPD
jgi:hypothetical protein